MHEALSAFAGYSGPRCARMVFVAEAWGENEAKLRKPLVGSSGQEFFRMLGEAMPDLSPELHSAACSMMKYDLAWVPHREAWLEAAGIGLTNVLALRPPNNNLETLCGTKSEVGADYKLPALSKGKYLRPEFLPELSRLFEEIDEVQPNLIVALGNTACWALLSATNIGSIRGATARANPVGVAEGQHSAEVKVLPTYHPAGVMRQWSWRPIVIVDLMKAAREARFPEIRRPTRSILINPTLSEVRRWILETMALPPPLLSIDTETSFGMIDTLGLARSRSDALVCMIGPHRVRVGTRFELTKPLRDGQEVLSYFSEAEELEFWTLVKRLLESSIPKLFQNGLYDLQYLLRMGIRPQACLEDTMLLHHALFPEMLKGLGFLGSIFTDEASWKLMRHRKADTEKRDE